MSYARWGCDGSDVYVYHSTYGDWVCQHLDPDDEDIGEHFKSREDLITHLEGHVARGHIVPAYVFDRLKKEIAEERAQ